MALSTPASGIKLGGGRRPPPDPSPQEGLRGQSPRSNERGEAARSSNLWRDGLRRLRKNRLAMAGGVVILLLCLVAVFADVLAPLPYTKTNFGRLNEAPSREQIAPDLVGAERELPDDLRRARVHARRARRADHRRADRRADRSPLRVPRR